MIGVLTTQYRNRAADIDGLAELGDSSATARARWYTPSADSTQTYPDGGVCGAGARPGLQIRCPALDKSEVGSTPTRFRHQGRAETAWRRTEKSAAKGSRPRARVRPRVVLARAP